MKKTKNLAVLQITERGKYELINFCDNLDEARVLIKKTTEENNNNYTFLRDYLVVEKYISLNSEGEVINNGWANEDML